MNKPVHAAAVLLVCWLAGCSGSTPSPSPAPTPSVAPTVTSTTAVTASTAPSATPKITVSPPPSAVVTAAIDPSKLSMFKPEQAPLSFADVEPNAYYHAELDIVTTYGVYAAADLSVFRPEAPVTAGEVVAIAARIHAKYNGNAVDFTATGDEAWYAPYVSYAAQNGLYTAFADYSATASCAEVAAVYSSMLPAAAYPTTISVDTVPRMEPTDLHFAAAVTLFRAGVLDAASFDPDSPCQRLNACAFYPARILDPSLRLIP